MFEDNYSKHERLFTLAVICCSCNLHLASPMCYRSPQNASPLLIDCWFGCFRVPHCWPRVHTRYGQKREIAKGRVPDVTVSVWNKTLHWHDRIRAPRCHGTTKPRNDSVGFIPATRGFQWIHLNLSSM